MSEEMARAPGGDDAPTDQARHWPSFALLGVVFLFWSNSFIAARHLVGEQVPEVARLDPLGFVAVRFAPVAILCAGWLLLHRSSRRQAALILRRHWGWVLFLGALNVWGYNLAFAAGHHRVPAGTGSLIITLNPVLTFLLAILLRQERFSRLRALGLAVAFWGVYLVVVHGAGEEVSAAYVEDAALLACAPLSWALYTVLGKRLLRDASALVLTYVILGIGSAPTVLVAALDSSVRATVRSWTWDRYAAALFLGLGCSLLAYGLWFVALKRLSASTVAAFVFLNPPLTLFFEWLWLGRAPSWGLLLGGCFVLAGVHLCISPRLGPWGKGNDDAGEARRGLRTPRDRAP